MYYIVLLYILWYETKYLVLKMPILEFIESLHVPEYIYIHFRSNVMFLKNVAILK
jgi:hypothetical protein